MKTVLSLLSCVVLAFSAFASDSTDSGMGSDSNSQIRVDSGSDSQSN